MDYNLVWQYNILLATYSWHQIQPDFQKLETYLLLAAYNLPDNRFSILFLKNM